MIDHEYARKIRSSYWTRGSCSTTTQTKAYSNDENIYGAIPNTKTSPVTLGHPGTLPVSNTKVIEYAVKLGLSVGAKIRRHNEYARKNYFYADLPKG